MNLSFTATGEARKEQSRSSKSRLIYNEKIYKSASEALEAYIEHFEGTTPLYRRNPSDLLSPQAKYYYMDSLERSQAGDKSPAKKVDELLQWVNQTYAKELSSTVEPFGYKTTPELPRSVSKHGRPSDMRSTSGNMHRSNGTQEVLLSNLPSPSSSVVDLDSNAESEATDILLSSYKGPRPFNSYPQSNVYKDPPHSSMAQSSSSRSLSRADGGTEYPSWVSSLGKEYPSWVEDLDNTTQTMRRSPHRHSSHRYYSGTTSSDAMKKSSSSSSPSLKVSDLYIRTTSPGTSKGKSKPRPAPPKTAIDWSDSASVDTEVLVSQPIYGVEPVNMGGDFHKPLRDDKKVLRLKKESTKKLRKSFESSARTVKFSERKSRRDTPQRFKASEFTGEIANGTLHPSSREDPRSESPVHKYKDLSPLRSMDITSSPVETLMPRPQYSMFPDGRLYDITVMESHDLPTSQRYPSPFSSSVQKKTRVAYGSSEVGIKSSPSPLRRDYRSSYVAGERLGKSHFMPDRRSHDTSEKWNEPSRSPVTSPEKEIETQPSREKRYTSPYSAPEIITESPMQRPYTSPYGKTTEPSQANRHHYPSLGKSSDYTTPLKVDVTRPRKEESDIDSMDTDKVMRQSPTGIKMRKMPRDPSTMYPAKLTSFRGSRYRDSETYTSPDSYTREHTFGRPKVHSTPMSDRKAPLRYNLQFDESTAPHKGTARRSAGDEPVKPDLSRSSDIRTPSPYRSKFMHPPSEIKGNPKVISRKPPLAPRGTLTRGPHRRSKTMPDLRRTALHKKSSSKSFGRSFDEDLLSCTTDDTESLVTRPPMPVVDTSPSLTTVSDSDTMVATDTETENEGYNIRRTARAPRKEGLGLSPTSVFASSNANAAVREELPGKYRLWKMDGDMKAPKPSTKEMVMERLANGKPQIISSFLEDCLKADGAEDKKISPERIGQREARLSGRARESGPVEALKQMLFTMQDMAHHEDDNGTPHSSAAKFVRDESSDEQSERSSEILRGEASLQRAYHHLERLKRLVGSEDDRSSISSAV